MSIFHLDPLWADDEIDLVGIDNYMPVSDHGRLFKALMTAHVPGCKSLEVSRANKPARYDRFVFSGPPAKQHQPDTTKPRRRKSAGFW